MQKSLPLLIALLGLVVASAVILYPLSTHDRAATAFDLTDATVLDHVTVDLGDQPPNITVRIPAALHNGTGEDWNVVGVESSCSCTTVDYPNVVPAGATRNVVLDLHTPLQGEIDVSTHVLLDGHRAVRIDVRGKVVRAFPAVVELGDIRRGAATAVIEPLQSFASDVKARSEDRRVSRTHVHDAEDGTVHVEVMLDLADHAGTFSVPVVLHQRDAEGQTVNWPVTIVGNVLADITVEPRQVLAETTGAIPAVVVRSNYGVPIQRVTGSPSVSPASPTVPTVAAAAVAHDRISATVTFTPVSQDAPTSRHVIPLNVELTDGRSETVVVTIFDFERSP